MVELNKVPPVLPADVVASFGSDSIGSCKTTQSMTSMFADVTKDSTDKKRKVTFDVPDSESESETKEKPKSRRFQNRKSAPPKPKFEPPPPDLDIKVRPILKKSDTPVYEAPIATTSLLPLHIINSIINAQLGPDIPDSCGEDSESENTTPDACDTSSNNLFVQNKNENNLKFCQKTNGEHENNSVDENIEENIDVWFLNSEEKQKEPVLHPPLKEEKQKKSQFITNNSFKKDSSLSPPKNSDSSVSKDNSKSLSSNKDSKSTGDPLKSPKPKRKLKVSINIQENGIETESKETFEIELGPKTSSDAEDCSKKDPSRVLQPLNGSEVNYIDNQCDDSYNLELSTPQTVVKTSSTEFSHVLSHLPPVIVEPEAPLPLRVSQSTYVYYPCEETFDTDSTVQRRLARKTSVEYHNAVVFSHPDILYNSVKEETQLYVSEITHLDYYCEEYSDTDLELSKAVPKTTCIEFYRPVIYLPPVILQNPENRKEIYVSEVNQLDSFCEEYLDLSEPSPQTLVTKTSPEYCNALTCSSPVVVQNHIKEVEVEENKLEVEEEEEENKLEVEEEEEENKLEVEDKLKVEEELKQVEEVKEVEKSSIVRRSSKTRRRSSVHFADLPDTEDKENLHQPSYPFDNRNEAQTNSVLQSISLESNTSPLSSPSPKFTKTSTESPRTTEFELTEKQYPLSSTYLNKFLKSPLQSTTNKNNLKSVKKQSDLETNPIPSQRILKPYQRKPRQPLAQIMDGSLDLNCAGESETLSPHKRDDIKEKDILIWIYNMIDEPARVDYEFFLKDGCILCKLMNRIKPGCIPEESITWEGAKSKQKNITNFLTQAESYGVPKGKLFYPEDLLHLRHIPRVTRCIYALAKIAQDDPNVSPKCPRLGDEPSFVEESKKVFVPGHRDTKEVLNQITSTMQKKEEGTGGEGGGGGGGKKLQRMHSLYN